MLVSKYIEEYWKTLRTSTEESCEVKVLDKMYYYFTDLMSDHSEIRGNVTDKIANNQRWAAIGVSRSALRPNTTHRALEVAISRAEKLGHKGRLIEFDLNVTVLSNSAMFSELFETYYLCELHQNSALSFKVPLPHPIEYLDVSCEHGEISESSSVGFNDQTAGLFKVGFQVKLTGLVLSPLSYKAPYVETIAVKFPE